MVRSCRSRSVVGPTQGTHRRQLQFVQKEPTSSETGLWLFCHKVKVVFHGIDVILAGRVHKPAYSSKDT